MHVHTYLRFVAALEQFFFTSLDFLKILADQIAHLYVFIDFIMLVLVGQFFPFASFAQGTSQVE